jgi:hypothetical protein
VLYTSGVATPEASDRVRREWLRRTEAEYRSAAITQHFGLWLIQIAAPPELIADSIRVVTDELAHAEMSHEAYVAAGGTDAPSMVRESLGLPRQSGPLEHDVLRHGVEVFCLGETVAVRLFTRLRSACTAPAARQVLDRVLVDEVRHRDFGWSVLDWLLSTPLESELRGVLERELPAMLGRVRDRYVIAGSSAPVFDEADRAWGLMPLAEYAAAVEETFQRDYAPRFAELSIDLPR